MTKQTRNKMLGLMLSILLVFLVVKVITIGSAIIQLAAIYTEAPFNAVTDNELVAGIQSGRLKPDAAGVVWNSVKTFGLNAYVTRPRNGLIVLIPSYMEHDSNSFGGYLFTSLPVTANKIMAYGPVRYAWQSPRHSFLMHLVADKQIDAHWYHVHGELYK